MTTSKNTSISTLKRLAVSLLLLVLTLPALAQTKMFRMENDSVPFFRGFSLAFDLVGPAMRMLSDHGDIGGALRVNLHDQWFPIFEMGIGMANHEDDEVTRITYKTTAPYFRIGVDWNVMKRKHQANRIFAGFRYGFTSYKVDIIRDNLPDPVWKSQSGFGVQGMACNMHWLECQNLRPLPPRLGRPLQAKAVPQRRRSGQHMVRPWIRHQRPRQPDSKLQRHHRHLMRYDG